MGAEGVVFMFMFAISGGHGGDLLDFMDTGFYWHTQDQRLVDVESMSEMLADPGTTSTDKLMAIRTLGEIGMTPAADADLKAAILKVLTPLATSNDPFVGQYARRSISWVKGADPGPRKRLTAQAIEQDLAILPHTSQIVAQLRVSNGIGPVDFSTLLPGLDRGEMLEMKQDIVKEVNRDAGQVVQMIGNARLDAITVGMTFFEDDDDNGYAVIVARGQYDRTAVQIAFQNIAKEEDEGEGWSFYSIGDIEVITKDGRWNAFAILMPSDQQFIFMAGEHNQGIKLYPIDVTADLIRRGDAQPTFNKQVTAQMAQIDRDKADAWVAMQVPPFMKNEGDISQVVGPFDTAHAYAVTDAEGVIDVSWKAEGQDPAAIAEAVKVMNKGIAEGRAEVREEMVRNQEMKPLFETLVAMMDSLHVESDGKTMTGGVKLPGGLGAMMPMMFMQNRAREIEAEEAQLAEPEIIQEGGAVLEEVPAE